VGTKTSIPENNFRTAKCGRMNRCRYGNGVYFDNMDRLIADGYADV
jgi:hypothetical protein